MSEFRFRFRRKLSVECLSCERKMLGRETCAYPARKRRVLVRGVGVQNAAGSRQQATGSRQQVAGCRLQYNNPKHTAKACHNAPPCCWRCRQVPSSACSCDTAGRTSRYPSPNLLHLSTQAGQAVWPKASRCARPLVLDPPLREQMPPLQQPPCVCGERHLGACHRSED